MLNYSLPQIQEKIKANPFPNEDIDPTVKASDEFGLRMANAIYWNGIRDENVTKRRSNIAVNRAYSRAQQDIDQYKPLLDAALDNKGDKSWMNIDWSIESPAPLIVKRLLGRFMNIDLKLYCNSMDANSRTARSKARDEFFGKMIQERDAKQFEAEFGVPVERPKGFVPGNDEELDLYMDMEFRLPIEIAMEELIDYTYNDNDWKEIHPRILRDLIENNKTAIRLYYDENNNIRMRYVDIERLIHPYTEDPFYNDVEYVGESIMLTIRDIRRLSDGKLTDKQLFEIAKMYSNKYGNPSWAFGEHWNYSGIYNGVNYNYEDYRIECLDFVFYTTDVYTYVKKESKDGKVFFDKKSKGYTPPERSNYKYDVLPKPVECEYEGLWVCGSGYMVKYGKSKNITRLNKDGKMSSKVLKKFKIVEPGLNKGVSKSLLDQIRPNLDTIQLAVLRKRHFLAEAIPPGLSIDWDSLMEVSTGLKMNPLEVVKMFKQKGLLFTKSRDVNDNQNLSRPVEFMTNGIGDAIRPFMDMIVQETNLIYSNLGLNTPADAMQPDKRSLIGLEKMALLESNNATRELYEGYAYGIFERAGLVISRMIQDKVRFNGGLSQYEPVIGQFGVKAIEFIPEDMTMAEFGIRVEALPDAAEVQELRIDVQKAVDSGEIGIDDKMEILSIMNTKKAARILAYKKRKRAEQAMQEEAQRKQMEAMVNQQSIQAAAEAEAMKAQAKAQAEAMVEQAKLAADKERIELNKLKALAEIDRKGYWELRKIEEAKKMSGGEIDIPNIQDPKVGSNPVEAATRVLE